MTARTDRPTPPLTPARRHPARGGFVLLLIAATLSIAACATTEDLAPPVGFGHESAAQVAGVDINVVRYGREIYLNQCIKCHAPEAVADYSERQWAKIIPDMAEESKLNAAQTEAVRQYVLTTLRMLATPTPTPPQP